MTSIPVDTNNMGANNVILASLRRASGPATKGQTVVAQDIATGTDITASVLEVRERALLLRLDWP